MKPATTTQILVVFTLLWLLLCWLFAPYCKGQTYYHDSALDSIQNNVGFVDSDVNAFGFTNHSDNQSLQSNLPPAIAQASLASNYIFAVTALQPYEATNPHNPYLNANSSVVISNSGVGGGTNRDAMQVLFKSFYSNGISSNFDSGSFNPSADTVDGYQNTTSAFAITFPNEFGTGNYTMHLGYFFSGLLPATMPSVVNFAIMTIVWSLIFLWLMYDLRQLIQESMNQKQIAGSTEEVLGVSASALAAIGYAVTITVALVTCLGIVLTSSAFGLIHSLGNWSIIENYMQSTISVIPAFSVVTTFIPIFQILGAFVYYLAFRFLGLEVAFTVVKTIMFWLPN